MDENFGLKEMLEKQRIELAKLKQKSEGV